MVVLICTVAGSALLAETGTKAIWHHWQIIHMVQCYRIKPGTTNEIEHKASSRLFSKCPWAITVTFMMWWRERSVCGNIKCFCYCFPRPLNFKCIVKQRPMPRLTIQHSFYESLQVYGTLDNRKQGSQQPSSFFLDSVWHHQFVHLNFHAQKWKIIGLGCLFFTGHILYTCSWSQQITPFFCQ